MRIGRKGRRRGRGTRWWQSRRRKTRGKCRCPLNNNLKANSTINTTYIQARVEI